MPRDNDLWIFILGACYGAEWAGGDLHGLFKPYQPGTVFENHLDGLEHHELQPIVAWLLLHGVECTPERTIFEAIQDKLAVDSAMEEINRLSTTVEMRPTTFGGLLDVDDFIAQVEEQVGKAKKALVAARQQVRGGQQGPADGH